jgi:hypothetical protein
LNAVTTCGSRWSWNRCISRALRNRVTASCSVKLRGGRSVVRSALVAVAVFPEWDTTSDSRARRSRWTVRTFMPIFFGNLRRGQAMRVLEEEIGYAEQARGTVTFGAAGWHCRFTRGSATFNGVIHAELTARPTAFVQFKCPGRLRLSRTQFTVPYMVGGKLGR